LVPLKPFCYYLSTLPTLPSCHRRRFLHTHVGTLPHTTTRTAHLRSLIEHIWGRKRALTPPIKRGMPLHRFLRATLALRTAFHLLVYVQRCSSTPISTAVPNPNICALALTPGPCLRSPMRIPLLDLCDSTFAFPTTLSKPLPAACRCDISAARFRVTRTCAYYCKHLCLFTRLSRTIQQQYVRTGSRCLYVLPRVHRHSSRDCCGVNTPRCAP